MESEVLTNFVLDILIFIMIIGNIILLSLLIKIYKQNKNIRNKKNIDYPENTNNPEETIHIQPIETPTEKEILMPYRKKYLLTKNEWGFYKELKPIADELGYTILAKVRVADLVEVTAKDKWINQSFLNKVTSKHVDFAIAKPENLKIELLIELDDNSHNEAQKERDDFINSLYKQTGYKLLRTRGTGELKEQIQLMLKDNPIENPRPLK